MPRPVRAPLARWLAAPGSLSARLARARPPFAVRLLRQGLAGAWPGEAQAIGLPPGQALVAREVLLLAGGQPCVFARSVTSARAARGTWRAIGGLGQRPLAALLFARRDVRRGPLAFAWLPACDPEVRAIARRWRAATGTPLPARGLWRRDSVFWRRGQGLRVAEYFLPGVLAGLPAAEPRWPLRPRAAPTAASPPGVFSPAARPPRAARG